MSVVGMLEQIAATSLSTSIRESTWLFPTIETVHVLALVLVVGSIALIDLRLLNLASRERSITGLSAEVLPWTWSAFAIALSSGLLLFMSSPVQYYGNVPFRLKMIVMVLAGLNMLLFHFVTYRTVEAWDQGDRIPLSAKFAGGMSLVLWMSIVTLGRWIGFV